MLREPTEARKQVVVEATFTMLIEVPSDWDADSVNFLLNESSRSAANLIDQLADEERRAEEGCCFACSRSRAVFIRDATEADIRNLTPPKPKADFEVPTPAPTVKIAYMPACPHCGSTGPRAGKAVGLADQVVIWFICGDCNGEFNRDGSPLRRAWSVMAKNS